MGCSSSKPDASAASSPSDAPRKTNSEMCREKSFYQKYILGRKLGQGSYGQVRAATSSEGEKVAVKVQKVKHDGKSREAWDTLRNESKMWAKVTGHPNIVSFFDDFETKSPATYFIVMEVCQCSVLDGLKNDSDALKCLSQCFREMALGLAHVHSRGVVHRDVKPDNFLLGGPDGQTTKLTDFGLSCILPGKSNIYQEAGSAPYMSPELLGKDGYREKTDGWSLGVTAYLMLYGTFPYMPEKLTNASMKEIIRKGTPSPSFKPSDPAISIPADAAAFVKDLLVRSPPKRCSMEQALLYGFVQPIEAPPEAVAPIEVKPPRKVEISPVVSEDAPAPMATVDEEPPADGPPDPPPPKVGSAQRNALSAAKALSRTGEFKKRPDPTVQRDLDDLLERLQKQYGTSKGCAPRRSFTGSALEVVAEDDKQTDLTMESIPSGLPIQVPAPNSSAQRKSAQGWQNMGATWCIGDGARNGSGDGLGDGAAEGRSTAEIDVDVDALAEMGVGDTFHI